MKKSLRLATIAAVICLSSAPLLAAPMGCNPHPQAVQSTFGTLADVLLTLIGI